jgi:hypothetical protein
MSKSPKTNQKMEEEGFTNSTRVYCPECEKMVDMENDICTECEEALSPDSMEFECPYCGKWSDSSGGCSHHVFTFETVNFEYISIDEKFEKQTVKKLRKLGFTLDRLPCPLEPWAEDDDGQSMPELEKLIPTLSVIGYSYSAPHGHGSWGVYAGYNKRITQSKKQAKTS